ncbi:MAG: LysR substrate-binding domain-containing protein, partial [Pseudomonadota bacterium]
QAVTRLEDDLGLRLLYRSTRSLSLTDPGAQFYAHCRDIRSSYDSALADIKTTNGDPRGTLTVTAPHALCAPVIVPSIARLLDVHSNIGVRLLAEDSPMDLIESQIDLAIRVGEPELQSAKVSKLGMLREGLYASPACVSAHGGIPEDLDGLADWPHIANDWQGTPVKYHGANGSAIRVDPRVRCNSLHDILQLAEAGVGVARLPDVTAAKSVAGSGLLRLFEVGTVPVYAMHLFPKRPPTKMRTFIDLVRKELRHGPFRRK